MTTTPAAPTKRQVFEAVKDAAVAMESYFSDAGVYAPDVARLAEVGYTPPPGIAIEVRSPGTTPYCLAGTGGGYTMYYSTADGRVGEKPCS